MQDPNRDLNCLPRRRLTGPEVHVYKHGRLYMKPSVFRIRRLYSATLRGTNLLLTHNVENSDHSHDIQLKHSKLLINRNHKKLIIQLQSRHKLVLFAHDGVEFDEWTSALSDSIHWRIQRFYEFGEVLGKGAFATVVKAWFKSTNDVVAVKIISKKLCSDDDLKYMQREIDIAKQLHHPNVVKTTDLFNSENTLYIVMEYMGGGTLTQFRAFNGAPSEDLAKSIMTDVFKAIQYLHENGVVHRDIKPENVLCSNVRAPVSVKLLDFGLARSFSSPSAQAIGSTDGDSEANVHDGINPDGLMTTPVGTPCFAAPEVLRSQPYGKEVDLFACGVVMYWLFCGYLPFDEKEPHKLVEQIKQTHFEFPEQDWASVSQHAKNVISGLLDRSPFTRLTASQALAHPWLLDDADIAGEKLKICDETMNHLEKKITADAIVQRTQNELRISCPAHKEQSITMPLLSSPVSPVAPEI